MISMGLPLSFMALDDFGIVKHDGHDLGGLVHDGGIDALGQAYPRKFTLASSTL